MRDVVGACRPVHQIVNREDLGIVTHHSVELPSRRSPTQKAVLFGIVYFKMLNGCGALFRSRRRTRL